MTVDWLDHGSVDATIGAVETAVNDQERASAAPSAGAIAAPTIEAINGTRTLVSFLGRDDLVRSLDAIVVRVRTPETTIAVVGEFKQGKSSLVNGLIGRNICPVDDDLATSVVTVLRHAEAPALMVFRGEVGEPADPAELSSLASELGNPDNKLGIARLEVGFPNAFLAHGVRLVDTPGLGGLSNGIAGAVEAFLPFADAVIFVSDLSQEMSAAELDLLHKCAARCPDVLVCLTKADLYAAADRIATIDRDHIARVLGPAAEQLVILTVSSHLRAEAYRRRDQSLNDESGYPGLLAALQTNVLDDATTRASARAMNEVRALLSDLQSALADQREALSDPSAAQAVAERLTEEKAALDHLRGPAARWSTVLTDGIADLSNEVNHHLRTRFRTLGRDIDEVLEAADSAKAWTDAVAQAQQQVADAVGDTYVRLESGIADLVATLTGVLRDPALTPDGVAARSVVDVLSLWNPRQNKNKGAGAAQQGLAFLGGVQSGFATLGTMAKLLPAAATTVLLANPVTIGAGLVMGVQRLTDSRKKQVAGRRQEVRQTVRQFIDDVQFEISNHIAESVRSVQRSLRDSVTARMAECVRTRNEAIESLKRDARATAEEQAERLAELDAVLASAAKILAYIETKR